jgi:hypothetical protein
VLVSIFLQLFAQDHGVAASDGTGDLFVVTLAPQPHTAYESRENRTNTESRENKELVNSVRSY